MGFLDDYDVDLDDFEASAGFDVPDGYYDFTINAAELRKGTSNEPDAVNIVLTYGLENAEGSTFSTTQWFRVPADRDHMTRRGDISMREWKALLLSANIKDMQGAGPEDLEGLSGTLRLVTTVSKKNGNEYQNIRNVQFDKSGDSAPKKLAPTKAKSAAKPAEKAAPAAKKSNPFAR